MMYFSSRLQRMQYIIFRTLFNVFMTLEQCIIRFLPLTKLHFRFKSHRRGFLFKLNSPFSHESNTEANRNYLGQRLVRRSNSDIMLACILNLLYLFSFLRSETSGNCLYISASLAIIMNITKKCSDCNCKLLLVVNFQIDIRWL